ncbi:U-box domain-containing protein 5-like isoform X2 [Brassica napus]|uniref:U-box domain-containing protein 5-like isoform X2 n=1 Tax=Brassica napus TaxID=3708 RepID=UPI000BBEFB4A|nr:U-box domain-containing protein 5-like isoform X2 [Brassica napus]
MGIDITTRIEKLPHSFKMHSSMCLELKNLVDSIMSIFPDIEDARPGSSSGIQTLCLLNKALEKAKLLLQYCSESSKLYMAVTGDGILSRGCRAKKLLEQSLSDIRSMITQIVQDLRSTVLSLEPSEEEAGKAVRELMQLSTSSPDEIRDFHFAALKLHLSTPEAIVIERRSLKSLFAKLGEREGDKRQVLKYLLCLLKKHEEIILRDNSFTQLQSVDDLVCASAVEAGCTDFNSSFSTESGTEVTDSTHREVEIGSLSSLLKMAESGADHLQEDAMNTLKSLSSSNEICLEMVSLGFVKNLTSLLQQIVFSKQSIIILRNLCNTEKGRVCITETPGCLASIAELLDSDVTEEQENAISILLQLCVEKIEYCSLVVREGVDIYSSLFLISNNGTEEAKVGASELLRALEEVDSNREEESSTLEGATTSQTVITPVKHQEPMLTTPSLKKSGLFGLRFPFSRRRKVC